MFNLSHSDKRGANKTPRSRPSPRRTAYSLLATLILGTFPFAQGHADKDIELGVRVGTLATNEAEDFTQYEVYGAYELPWRRHLGSSWILGTRLNASLGVLRGDDEEGFIGKVGPGLTLNREGSPWTLDIALSLTGLTEDEFEQQDLGGNIQFSSSLGLNYRFGATSLGYRFLHMSNAGLDDTNPGLEMHMLELGRYF